MLFLTSIFLYITQNILKIQQLSPKGKPKRLMQNVSQDFKAFKPANPEFEIF